jgi:hypothetical protein
MNQPRGSKIFSTLKINEQNVCNICFIVHTSKMWRVAWQEEISNT